MVKVVFLVYLNQNLTVWSVERRLGFLWLKKQKHCFLLGDTITELNRENVSYASDPPNPAQNTYNVQTLLSKSNHVSFMSISIREHFSLMITPDLCPVCVYSLLGLVCF